MEKDLIRSRNNENFVNSQIEEDYSKLKFKKLLVVAPSYPDKDNLYIGGVFVKNQLEIIKKYFDEIFIIAPIFFSFKVLLKDKLCINYAYDNIKVYFPRCFYIPIFYFSEFLIDNRLKVIENLIEKEKIEFDLIHAHFTWPSAYIGSELKKKFNRPVIVTIHESSNIFENEVNMNNSHIIHAWKNADALIRVNKKDVPILKTYNKNVFSIPNGFLPKFKPLNKNECIRKLNIPFDKRILFSLGVLTERKGFKYLIDSMKIITGKRKDILCYIGGRGSLRDKLQKQINDMKLQNHVKLMGFVPDELVPLWMNACDMFVFPSISEGNPTVMFECLGCGKPFIGTKVGGVPEVIISEEYGLLCEPGNSKDLAKNILIALNKEWDFKKIEAYSAQFTWEAIAKEILNVLSKSGFNNLDDPTLITNMTEVRKF